ncbi:hypothetical protein WR25_03134 [Diploscapter pachys]|uniref:Uncharacterized protein n=1 Tax=Diploscapter pachys TaxID=2018661 RepID=A0A2A2M4I3_9BILA|nr:hypothetical protein WR25_03134 [Diploscapter pachys]
MNPRLMESIATSQTNAETPSAICSPEILAMRIGPPNSSIERRPLMIWPIVSSVPPMISPVIRTPAIGASARLTGASKGSPLCKPSRPMRYSLPNRSR